MNLKEKSFVSAVIYAHNAETRIEPFFKAVLPVLQSNFEHFEIICVNDYSEDAGIEKLKTLCKNFKLVGVSVLNLSRFVGVEAAMRAGVDLSIGDFVYEFDSTILDFEPAEIMRIYRKALEGYDIVSAAPNHKERLSSKAFYRLLRHFGTTERQMVTERFRILSRRAINRISSMNKTVLYRKAAYANCGLKTERLEYSCVSTSFKEKPDLRERKYRQELATNSLILLTSIGYQFSMMITLFMMLFSIFMICYSVVTYLSANPVAGWTTQILFLSISFSGLFGILTIVIKYLQLLVDLSFKREQYSFESIEKISG